MLGEFMHPSTPLVSRNLRLVQCKWAIELCRRICVLSRMKGFDTILGMDWLSKYYATIDCESKVIIFREPSQEEVVYRVCKARSLL